MRKNSTSIGLGMQISSSLSLEDIRIIVFKVKSRKFRNVGDKSDRLRKWVELAGRVLYSHESEPYGMHYNEVERAIESKLSNLREALSISGVNSSVIREDV